MKTFFIEVFGTAGSESDLIFSEIRMADRRWRIEIRRNVGIRQKTYFIVHETVESEVNNEFQENLIFDSDTTTSKTMRYHLLSKSKYFRGSRSAI